MTLEKPMARLAQRLDRNGGARAISSYQTRLVHTFGVGGPAPAAWREHVFTRVAELQTLTALLTASRSPNADLLRDAIDAHLDSARAAAETSAEQSPWRRLVAGVTGSDVERAMSNLDAAEATLLRLAPTSFLRGQMPSLLTCVRHHLPANDPRRVRMEDLARHATNGGFQDYERDVIVAARRGAASEARREIMRVRSFRNVLLVAAFLLVLVAAGVAVLGLMRPQAVALCFTPDDAKVVCPTAESPLGANADRDAVIAQTTSPTDLLLVEVVGLIAAAVSAAASVRNIRGTSTPYALPVALALLKLPTGALTAFLGLLLMRGQFVPGLSALDFPAQIIAWAVVFGYAQQLLTRLVDQQAHSVLDDVGAAASRGSPG